jgi:membrane protein DedA with SNARE-associated domain
MLNDWPGFVAAYDLALSGMAMPWLICTALILTTLLLEDLAIAAGAALAAQGSLSWPSAFAAVAFGIAAGDLALYALGAAAKRSAWLRRRLPQQRGMQASRWLGRSLPGAVLLARVIPGLRLLTYTACGYLRTPLAPFCAWVVVAVLLWTAALFWLAAAAGDVLARSFGLSAPVAVALPIVVLALLAMLFGRLRAPSP